MVKRVRQDTENIETAYERILEHFVPHEDT